jgi:adenylate cyclase class 2
MPDELESKIRVADHESVRARLRETGAEYISRVLETNRLFDDQKWTLLKSGCGLRVRECLPLEGPGPSATLTYKGPVRESEFKQRSEIEFPIASAGAMIEILHKLGFFERIIFEKKRESWRLDPCKVELDEVPTLGRFVEVEGPDPKTIKRIVGQLGLDATASIRKSYVALLADGASTSSPRPLEFRFA